MTARGAPNPAADAGRRGIQYSRLFLVAVSLAMTSLAARAAASDPHAPVADLILTNGVIYTMDPAQPVAQAIALTAGAISYVGSDAGVRQLRARKTQVVNLGGKTVLPGLIDSHVHPALGEFLNHHLCNVHGFTLEEGFTGVRHCAAIAPAGDWVVGYGWYDLDDPATDTVTLAQIDALVPDRKLAIISRDLHTVWVNSKTLKEFGIGRDTVSPPGGKIVHDPVTGEPTGMLIDAANHAITDKIQHDSPYALSTPDLTRAAMAHLNSLGITSLLDAFTDDDAATVYHALDVAGKLTMRVELAFAVLPDNYRSEIGRIAANRAKWRSAHVRSDYVKVFADGNGEVGLASLLNHDGPPETSTPGYYTATQMRELVALTERAGLSVFVHAIGDGAARQVLDAVAAARAASPTTNSRHTITHLCWVADADMPRFNALHVLANIQEDWLAPGAFGGPPGYDYARATAAGPLGPWLAGRLMPYRALYEAGARISAGSDWFYTEENPWFTMEAGITSKDPGGPNPQAMLPNYTLDLSTLLRAHTVNAAYQLFLENEVGVLATGKRGDLIVVDQDPFTTPIESLHKTAVLTTYLDGHVVYRRPSAPASTRGSGAVATH